MPNNIDRELQKKLMFGLANVYPRRLFIKDLTRICTEGMPKVPASETVFETIAANLEYLAEHGLVTVVKQEVFNGPVLVVNSKITAKGLDFLADDGGLTAVLGVVTVKLHADTIKDLVIAKIQSSEAKPSVKEDLISTIKKLPARGLEKLLFAGFEKGIGAVPNVVEWAKNMLS